jgi:hypothetical protein
VQINHLKPRKMKFIIICLCALVFPLLTNGGNFVRSTDHSANAPLTFGQTDQKSADQTSSSGIKLKIIGNLYVAPENWSKVGDANDSKFGVGLGGMIGLGLKIDDLVFGVGPHMGINRWEANYSNKSVSATTSVYYELVDTGIEGVFYMKMGKSKFAIFLGKGETEISGGYVVNGQTIMYPDTNKAKESYNNVGIGFYIGKILISPSYVTYTGVAKAAERLEIRIGLAF